MSVTTMDCTEGTSSTIDNVVSSSDHGRSEEHVVHIREVLSKELKSERLIGKGPSSIVYETTWEGNSCARKDFLRVPSDIFVSEVDTLNIPDHPNVVRTYGWTVDEGSCSLVVELMSDNLLNMMRKRKYSRRKNSSGSGSASQISHTIDLHKFSEDGKNTPIGTSSESVSIPLVYPFNLKEALQIMLEIAEGMKFLHDNGVVHGDLKPKNVLVSPTGRVMSSSLDQIMAFQFKVADFGLVETKMNSRNLISRQARKLELVRWRAPELLDFREDEEHESSTKLDWDSDSSEGIIGVNVRNISVEDMKLADVYNFSLTCSQILTGEDRDPSLSLNDFVGGKPLSWEFELPYAFYAQLCGLLNRCGGPKTERLCFQDIIKELKDLQASLSRTDFVLDIEKNTTITKPTSARIDTPELEIVPGNKAVSEQPSEKPGGSSNSSPGLKTDWIIDVPFGNEEQLSFDREARERAQYDARERALEAKYRHEEQVRKARQQAERQRRGIQIPAECDTDSGDDDECYKEIKNLAWIESRLIHKTALQEWARKESLFTSRVERKTKSVGKLKNEMYQLIGFFIVFQGVVLTAVAQSNLLHCNNWWSPVVLSVISSVATITGVTQKLSQVSSLQKTIFTEERALKDAVHRGAALRRAGEDFIFAKLGKVKRKEGSKNSRFWTLYSGLVLSVLLLFATGFPLSHWRTLCHPGPNPYN